MAEAEAMKEEDHRLAVERHYEAGPPEGLEIVEPGETFATTKEEEWVSKKTTEVTNTKQIETRVKRQVVLEDGKVVEDSGPVVTTNTTEDTEKQEHHQTELRKLGDDKDKENKALESGDKAIPDKPDEKKWVSVPNPDGIVREVNERRVISREETEEVRETEDVQHLGDITDEAFLAAVRSGESDLRQVLRSQEAGRTIVSTGPRVVNESHKSNKVVDTEDTRELSSVLPDGRIVTETQRTTEHEEVKDDELPEGAPHQDEHRESHQRFFKARDQEDVDYVVDGVKVGHEMRFRAETTEAERRGDGVDEPDWDSLSARAKRRQNMKHYQRTKGISEWSERERDTYTREHRASPVIIRNTPSPQPYGYQRPSPTREYRKSPLRDDSPPPQRKRAERPQRLVPEDDRPGNGYRAYSRNGLRDEPLEEPPPDYSPTSPPRAPTPNKKAHQKTRFAVDTPPVKQKSGNIIGQSIRKLVGKIRSASAERKAKQQQQRAKRSPSPSYKPGHVIDNIHEGSNGQMENGSRRPNSPVHRYYLGEDPFGGSIYGRENKYDGVKPARPSRRHEQRYGHEQEEYRSHSTLGRFSKSATRAERTSPDRRNSQTLPRHSSRHEPPSRLEKDQRSNSTINVSFINTVSAPKIVNGGPAKPARTYKSNLSRSKSFNVDLDSPGMHKPQLPAPSGLKSPGLISSISRSQRDLRDETDYRSTSRFVRNGVSDNKRVFLKDLRQRAPELYKTLHEEDESWRRSPVSSTPIKPPRNKYNGDIYEPPTRLRDTFKESYAPALSSPSRTLIRKGSNSSNDYSETYHTTTRSEDPMRPSVTDTVQSFSKKTVPTKDGRGYQTIESSETKSITKSRYQEPTRFKRYETGRHNGSTYQSPVVIEVRNNYK